MTVSYTHLDVYKRQDTYYVDDAGDVVTEAAGEGTETVLATVNLVLGANVEKAIYTGAGNWRCV